MLGTSNAYRFAPIPSRYYSGGGFPSLRMKDCCCSPELCALDSCGSQRSLGCSQSQPKVQTNICSDELPPKRQSNQAAGVDGCSADNCLSPGFRTEYERTFLSINCKERMNSSLYHRHRFYRDHLWYVSHSSTELWSSPYPVCLLLVCHTSPASGSRKEQQEATPKQCCFRKHCLRSDSSPLHKRL